MLFGLVCPVYRWKRLGFIVFLEATKTAGMIILLVYTSILDYRSREVPPSLWLISAAIFSVMTGYELFYFRSVSYALVALVGCALVSVAIGVLYYIGLMGGGDLFAFITLSLANPWNPINIIHGGLGRITIPFVIPVLVYSSLGASLIVPFYLIYNILKNRKELSRLPRKYKIVYLVTGVPMRISELLSRRYWYPLERPWSRDRYRTYFDVGEEEEDVKSILRALLEKGEVSSNDKLWATYGLPFIVFITAGYIFSLIGGDKILLKLLMSIFG